MKYLSNIRYLTYAVLIAIALLEGRKRYFIEVPFEPQPFVPSANVSEWNGKGEAWLRRNLSDCHLWKDILVKTQEKNLDSGVRAALDKEKPGYCGFIRHMEWVKDLGGLKSRKIEIYLIEENSDWIILAARSDEEQMTM